MKVIIAPDSFKDALSARDVAEAIQQGIKMASPDDETVIFPLGDGGEGSSEILGDHLNAVKKVVEVEDALGRPVVAYYYFSKENRTALIEMAQASGLQRISYDERNCMEASSFGTGQMMLDAIRSGAVKIVLAIGGSATNDAGMGMATALGIKFYDKDNQLLKGRGCELQQVHHYDKSQLLIPDDLTIDVLCDVENPLFGENGAAYVYACQKGAGDKEIELLDKGLRHFSAAVRKQEEKDFAKIQGAGAAGGLGFGAMVFLNAKLQKGIDLMLVLTGFDAQIKGADFIITGEGKIDGQTIHGKLISGIVQHAQKQDIPVIALCGTLDSNPESIQELGLYAAFSIQSKPGTLEDALKRTSHDLALTAFNMRRLL
jgi:glycerate kinase